MKCWNTQNAATFIFSLLASLLLFSPPALALVKIEPDPVELSAFSDFNFTVNVTISGVDNVYGFQFDIEYDPDILEVSAVSEGTFLNNSGLDKTFCLGPDLSTSGLINDFACSRIGQGDVSGTGVLASITFGLKPVKADPLFTTQLVISDLKLSDINSQPLDNSTQDGQVRIYECLNGETRSCSVNGCEGTKTCNSSNEWGECVPSGGENEICDGLDNDCDGLVDEGLSRDCSENHYGVCAVGTETCSDGEWSGCPQPENEICENGIDEDCDGEDSPCMGDIVDDGCVDIQDLVIVGSNFGLTSGFDPRADVNSDGEVDIFDLVIIGRDFGNGADC